MIYYFTAFIVTYYLYLTRNIQTPLPLHAFVFIVIDYFQLLILKSLFKKDNFEEKIRQIPHYY